jgi:hypothetical protein
MQCTTFVSLQTGRIDEDSLGFATIDDAERSVSRRMCFATDDADLLAYEPID